MALLDEVIEAGGGLTRWNGLNRFTLQLSIGGSFLSRANASVRFKEIAAQGCLRNPLVRVTGFTGFGQSGVYRPDCVSIEDPDGHVIRTWRDPHHALLHHDNDTLFDELFVVFLSGYCIWNYLTVPFILAHPDVKVEELPPWRERDHLWRRLRAVFPPSFVTKAHTQILYFDEARLQRRTDYALFGSSVAEYSWAHQEFAGIVVPTLRRTRVLEADETEIARPSLIEVEIFDAAFE